MFASTLAVTTAFASSACLTFVPQQAGESPAGADGAPRFVAYPGDALVYGDQLFVAARVDHPKRGELVLRLSGGGSSAEQPIVGSVGESRECWGLGSIGNAFHPSGCSFPMSGLSKGEYKLEAVQGGEVLGTGPSFRLVDVPSAAGSPPVLAVDPAFGALRAMSDRGRFRAWIPVDARHAVRLATVVLFHEGEVVVEDSSTIEGPPLVPGMPLAWLQPLAAGSSGNPSAALRGAKKGRSVPSAEALAWDRAVVVLDGETPVGTWARESPDGELKASSDDGALLPRAREAARKAWEKEMSTGRSRALAGEYEDVVCAYATNPAVLKLIQNRTRQKEEVGGSQYDAEKRAETAQDETQSAAVRRRAAAQLKAADSNTRGFQKSMLEADDAVHAAAKKFEVGCLAKILAPTFGKVQAALDAPRAGIVAKGKGRP